MKRILLLFLAALPLILNASDYVPADYVWTTQSRNSSESMPCGGGDIGMNVWVEGGDLLVYISRSGMFDDNNTLLKAGRIRITLTPNPFVSQKDFRQALHLDDGSVTVGNKDANIRIWADVDKPLIYFDVNSHKPVAATVKYENWRYRDRLITKAECQQCSYKWILPDSTFTRHDSVIAQHSAVTFIHQNNKQTVFDYTVKLEGLDSVKQQLYNPLSEKRYEATMSMPGFHFTGTKDSIYASTDYRAWTYTSDKTLKKSLITIAFDGCQPSPASLSRRNSAKWWHAYWQRSYIIGEGDFANITRNYELFRYMLGCNARGQWPTKFNGGLFTFDPVYVDAKMPFTPDYRRWGGGTMTAQNQRLVYWPLLKSGDVDLMTAQFETYLRMLPSATARVKYFWHHDGACFTEQLENFGLPNPAEYGAKRPTGFDRGMQRNAWLEYLWDTSLEFCQMILEAKNYYHIDISRYEPLIKGCLTFFDEHYRYLAKLRGTKELDSNGDIIIYPGSGCETYKMAYNPASTIAALRTVLKTWGKDSAMLSRIPEIPLRTISGDTCIAPARVWQRINNEETPQLYPVFPWRIYGMGRPHIEIARNTYLKDADALHFRSSKGWKQDNIWAACLGLTDEAVRLTKEKFADGPYRFPAFWEPGFDWAPDNNRGGSAMIGLQEMLLQESPTGEPILFPSWPRTINVRFRLHASGGRTIEAEMRDGKIIIK